MITIIDYGMGNLKSVEKAFESVGAEVNVSQDKHNIQSADKIVLPGVGAIKPAVDRLRDLGLIAVIKDVVKAGVPFLGICLGFQLLFEESYEGGLVKGLGILQGRVKRFPSTVKVPHMGWNQLRLNINNCPIFKGLGFPVNVYFCHSYYVDVLNKNIVATFTDYDTEFASSVYCGNIFGVQFHPEKSQQEGLRILKNFAEL